IFYWTSTNMQIKPVEAMGACLLVKELNALREKIRLGFGFGRVGLWARIGFGLSSKYVQKNLL
ncbi:hypothetical protein S83_072039, partial [Arachis hypogaea]